MVNPGDIYVLAGLVASDREHWTYRGLAAELDVPLPFVQRALKRSAEAGLYDPELRRVRLPNFEEFLLHAVRYVAPARLGEVVPGVPAAWAAEPVSSEIREPGSALPPVWPSAVGRVRGQAIDPLHKGAVSAAERNPRLSAILAIIDSLRAGNARVRSVAAALVRDELLGRGARWE